MHNTPPGRFPTLKLATALGIPLEEPTGPIPCDHPYHPTVPATHWVLTAGRPPGAGDTVRTACELCSANARIEARDRLYPHELTPITEPRPRTRQLRLFT